MIARVVDLPVEEEPSGVHRLSCAVWLSPDPTDACDCGAELDEREAS